MNKRYAVVGQRIKYLREKYDLNKTEFAKRIGVTERQLLAMNQVK